MNSSQRKKKLDEIKNSEEPTRTGVPVTYKGERRRFDVYKIPLKFLIYNQYNGRIGSAVKAYEKENHPLDPEDPEDKKIIEDLLWESKESRNKKTMESLVKNHQLEEGIVTSDGKIIDGNRRAMLLNKIYESRDEYVDTIDVDHARFFEAIILPDDADERDIDQLETVFQMGEDKKLDYNPIEKYLKCKQLRSHDFTPSDIAEMMSEPESQIETWLETAELMDDYLKYLGPEYEDMYILLDKREDQFLQLNRWMKRYKGGTSTVEWAYDDMDVSELKAIVFDYIRAQYEGKDFRTIANTGTKGSIFKKKQVWDTFKEKHEKVREHTQNQKPLEEYREENKDQGLRKVYKLREQEWKENTEDLLEEHLREGMSRLEDIQSRNEPIRLIEKAHSAMTQINISSEQLYENGEVESMVKKINSICYKIMKNF